MERLNEGLEVLNLISAMINNGGSNKTPSFSSYIRHYGSKMSELPRDTSEPFVDDVIEYAQGVPMQILLIGKVRGGRSVLGRGLAKKLDVEYVDLERGVNGVFARVAENEENPQLDEEGNAKEFLSEVEREMVNGLRRGECVS